MITLIQEPATGTKLLVASARVARAFRPDPRQPAFCFIDGSPLAHTMLATALTPADLPALIEELLRP